MRREDQIKEMTTHRYAQNLEEVSEGFGNDSVLFWPVQKLLGFVRQRLGYIHPSSMHFLYFVGMYIFRSGVAL